MSSNGHPRQRKANGNQPEISNGKPMNGHITSKATSKTPADTTASTLNLLICVGGIYASL